jgi:hypothetical protein
MGSGRRIARVGCIAASLLALGAPAALAANRYASPDGTSEAPCTEAIPCDIATAINGAGAGDNVTLNPGTYGSATPLTTVLSDHGKAMSIHGITGEPRPVIDTTAEFGIELDAGSILGNLEVDDTSTQTGAAAIWAEGTAATISDVVGIDTSPRGIACYPDGTLTDSLCWASGAEGVAATPLIISSVSATLRNDTLIASGTGGDAVEVNGESNTTMTVSLSNTIARGAGDDIFVDSNPSDTTGTVTVSAYNSNFSTVKNGGGGGTFNVPSSTTNGNQGAEPVFADPATGNFHELATSPTIAAGGDSAADGSTDLDGNPREVGGHTDIGAYEFIPSPLCSPGSASTKYATATHIQLGCTFVLGGTLAYAITGGPSHGTASISSTGLISYRPASGFSGHDTIVYTVTSDSQTTTTGSVSITVGQEPKPSLSKTRQTHGKWLERKPRRHTKTPVGTTFSFVLNEPATVKVGFTQKRHGKTVTVAKLTVNGVTGTNKVRFAGRAGKKTLSAGRYTATLTAANSGGSSGSHRLNFTVASGMLKLG